MRDVSGMTFLLVIVGDDGESLIANQTHRQQICASGRRKPQEPAGCLAAERFGGVRGASGSPSW
jgi:hypothetical protein